MMTSMPSYTTENIPLKKSQLMEFNSSDKKIWLLNKIVIIYISNISIVNFWEEWLQSDF